MAIRAETAAATREALLRAASALLDRGGVEAVTLREVGGGAGVSRTAPYRHFADKEALLRAISAGAWESLTARVAEIAADPALSPGARLRASIDEIMAIARTRPHLYRLMLDRKSGTAVEAGLRSQDVFLTIVTGVVEPDRAPKFAGLLLATLHGVADLELGGYLSAEKWGADGDELIELLVASVSRP